LNACNTQIGESVKIFHDGSYTIKARYIDGRRNGKTEFYDNSGHLTGVVNYKDDAKWGMCIHYYSNGVVSDSILYECDKPKGYWRHYDQAGEPTHFSYYYFGLQYGPELWYDKDTVLRTYKFLDFEKQAILECSYNSRGHIEAIKNIALPISLEERKKNGVDMFDFFAYLPRIPLVKHTYYLGVADANKVMHKLCNIQGENFFIDTLLVAPPPGSHFYLGCDLKAVEGGIDTTLVTEAIKK
jgi:hypothetical protein